MEIERKILLSIKPEYAEKILNGTKLFEFRKNIPRDKSIRKIIIYATKPIGMVVGEFEFDEVLRESPENLWQRTKDGAGITKDFFDQYFSGCKNACAVVIKNPKRYSAPKELKSVSGSSTPPQSFRYITID